MSKTVFSTLAPIVCANTVPLPAGKQRAKNPEGVRLDTFGVLK